MRCVRRKEMGEEAMSCKPFGPQEGLGFTVGEKGGPLMGFEQSHDLT